jgi:hypothetical protein
MSNQNKILSLRKLDRVGQLTDANLNQLQSDNLPSYEGKLESDGTITLVDPAARAVSVEQQRSIQQYIKNGLEYVMNGGYVTTLPGPRIINQRNESGEFILIENTDDIDVTNQSYYIEPNYEQLQQVSVNNVIDTQFRYFKFPPTITVTPVTQITTTEIDLEINDDLKAYQAAVLESLAGIQAAQEAAQEGGGSTSGERDGFDVINVTDNIYLSFNPIVRGFNQAIPTVFTDDQVLRTGFNWPDNKFLGESESTLQKIAAGAAIGLSAVGAAAGIALAGVFAVPVAVAAAAPAASIVGGALIGLVANGGLKADKNYVTISYQLSGQYEDGQDADGNTYGLRALFVRGTSDSNLTGKELYNKAKQADKDKNFKRLTEGLETVSGVDENGETISVTFGTIQIQSPTNKYEDDYYLIIEVGAGSDAKDFVGIEETRVKLGPITTVKAKTKDDDDKIKLEIKNKNNSQPDFEYNNSFSV